MINTVREEMRDQMRLIISSVDSLMITNCLILEIAGMFACEGTFPNQDHLSRTDDDYVGWQYVAIHAYSVLLALTMAFSLGSLLAATAIRLEAQACFQEITGDRGNMLPDIWQRIEQAVRQSDCGVYRRAKAFDDAEDLNVDRDIVQFLMEGVLEKARYYYILHPVAQTLLFLCVLCGVASCALLMSLITSQHYPSNPLVTLAYSGTVGLGFLGSIAFWIWMRRSLRRRKLAPSARPGRHCERPPSRAEWCDEAERRRPWGPSGVDSGAGSPRRRASAPRA